MPKQEQQKYGKARFGPQADITAGSRGTWSIVYEVGQIGILIGGGIRIIPPMQGEARWEVGQIIAYTSRQGSVATVSTFNTYPLCYHLARYPIIDVKTWNRPLKQNDTITVIIGNKGDFISGYNVPARAQEFAINGAEFGILVDPYGFGCYFEKFELRYIKLPQPPKVNVIPDKPARLVITVSPTPKLDQSLNIHVKAEDKYGNLAPTYQGTIKFLLNPESGGVDFPSEYSFTPEYKGIHSFAGQVKGTFKAGFITVMDSKNLLLARSNPFSTTITQQLPYNIYFGEIHAHTEQSDGLGTIDEAYTYARDVADLDFAAITDHEGGRNWEAAQKGVRDYYQPHKFVTFLGYEYSRAGKYGHKNVYYLKDDEPVYSPDSPEKLWKFFEGKDAIVIPHHPNVAAEIPDVWKQQDWSFHNEKFERLVEICQNSGSFETDSLSEYVLFGGYGASVQNALAKGYKLGFTGGTDNHRGQLSSGRFSQLGLDYHGAKRSGLIGVYAKELTREAIWDALYNRRTYATTGARILLKVSIQGHIMGKEFETKDMPVVEVSTIGTAGIEKIELIKNNINIHTHKAKSFVGNFKYLDEKIVPGVCWYYVRVTQEDGEMAWSSPLWVNYKAK